MKRVVFDTNTVASASFWKGPPMECLRAWQAGRCESLVSPAILAEYVEVTDRLQARDPERSPVRWAAALAASAELVFPSVRLRRITPDPDDEVFLECAGFGLFHPPRSSKSSGKNDEPSRCALLRDAPTPDVGSVPVSLHGAASSDPRSSAAILPKCPLETSRADPTLGPLP